MILFKKNDSIWNINIIILLIISYHEHVEQFNVQLVYNNIKSKETWPVKRNKCVKSARTKYQNTSVRNVS